MYLANSNARAIVALEALLQRPGVRELLAVLNREGEEARVIGGAVRDCLMGRSVGDIDIATTALPAVVVERVKAMGWKSVPTGIEHGTVTVVINSMPFEVTTLRRDVATDGRRAVVAFSRDFAEDAMRRDFTINAMSVSGASSVSHDITIHDYATGRDDARVACIRFMGHPETRIREDYLRILRFFRFHASHGRDAPEAAGLAACILEKQGLNQLSRERIRQELIKLVMAHGATDAIQAMVDAGIWDVLLPGFMVSVHAFKTLLVLEAQGEDVAGSNPIRRLAVLLQPSRDQVSTLPDLLRLSRREEAQLAHIFKWAPLLAAAKPDKTMFARCYLAAGASDAVDALLVGLAGCDQTQETISGWFETVVEVIDQKPVMPFRNVNFDGLGIAAGPQRGALIQDATERWIKAGFPADKSTLKLILEAACAALEQH